MKADGSLKSLLQGVSQQPTRDRLPGQCTEQINMTSDPVRGLSRRGGGDFVGIVGTGTNIIGFQTAVLKGGRKSLLTIMDDGIEAHDYNAVSIPVTHTDNLDYYNHTGASWSSVDYRSDTYLANNAVVTAMRADTYSYPNIVRPTGIIQILGGKYGTHYSVIVDGVTVARLGTVNGSAADHSQWVSTRFIAEALAWLLTHDNTDAVPGAWPSTSNPNVEYYRTGFAKGTGWEVSFIEDLIAVVSPVGGGTFSLTVADGAGGINAKAMTDNVPDIADLPKWAYQDYVVRVAQETDPEEDLWLKFIVSDSSVPPGLGFGMEGAWYETTAPGLKLGFDHDTMPRKLTYDGTTITVSHGGFKDRTVGTEVTNPEPSFVGYSINDLSVFQSRLVMVAGDSLCASRSRKPDNFWIGSASALVDSDPLDVTSQAAAATVLKWCVPHNKDLVIFSEVGQFVLFGRQAITPSNAALAPTTTFEANMAAKPVPSGRNVFFATSFGRFTGIREFYTEGGTDINDTRPITQHVNKYLLGSVAHLSSTSNYDTLLVHTDNDRKQVYQYQFIWSDTEKVQSAWSKWTMPHDVVYSFFDEDVIYFVSKAVISGTTVYILQRLNLDIQDEAGVGYSVHMDYKFDVTGVNTQFTLPHAFYSDQSLIVVQSTDCPYPGLPARVESVVFDGGLGEWVVTLRDDMEGGDIVVGVSNRALYKPTMPRVKDQSGDTIGNARLVIAQFLLALERTGHLIGRKTSKYGTYPEVPFEGYIVNDPGTIVGEPALSDTVFKMPFKEKVQLAEVEFYTERHYPLTILDIEWDGTVNKRGRRIQTGE